MPHDLIFSLADFIHVAGDEALTDESATTDFIGDCLDDFTSQEMTFKPIISDDEVNLTQRLGELADFCAGFLSGFGASAQPEGDGGIQALPDDVQEIIRDFAAISRLNDDAEEDEEDQDEGAFAEIYEYVRVASVLVLTLMSEDSAS